MKRTRKFTSKLDVLGEVCDFVTHSAKECGLNEAQVYAVQLAVDEAATNIIEHAYKGHSVGEFEITCQSLDEGIAVTLHDHGNTFDPESVPQPLLNVPLEELRSRGLGVFLIRKMMDQVEYEFSPERGNTLRMIKRKGG